MENQTASDITLLATNQQVINSIDNSVSSKPVYRSKKLFTKSPFLSEERLDICKEIFLKYLTLNKIDKTKYNDIIPISVQLTSICWRKFKFFIDGYGYSAKRRKITDAELASLRDKSKRPKYIISVIKSDKTSTAKKKTLNDIVDEMSEHIGDSIERNNSSSNDNTAIPNSKNLHDHFDLPNNANSFEGNIFYFPTDGQWPLHNL